MVIVPFNMKTQQTSTFDKEMYERLKLIEKVEKKRR